MLASFLLSLHEGLEAALIIGIENSPLRRIWIQNVLILGIGLALGVLLGWVILLRPAWIQSRLAVGSFLQETSAQAIGRSAPDFALESLTGSTVRLSDLRGHPTLINFWTTWCGSCRQEMPLLEKYHQNRPDLVMLAVNAGEDRDQVQAFVDEFGLTFDVLLDPNTQIQSLYDIRGYPTTFFVDKQGSIRAVVMGPISESSLPGYLEKIGVKP